MRKMANENKQKKQHQSETKRQTNKNLNHKIYMIERFSQRRKLNKWVYKNRMFDKK